MTYLCGMNLEKEQYRALKLLHSKCRQGFLEVSEGDEAYDQLQLIITKTKIMNTNTDQILELANDLRINEEIIQESNRKIKVANERIAINGKKLHNLSKIYHN